MALVNCFVDSGFGVWHQKLKGLGGDLGGAVKGFKDGMRDGSAAAEDKSDAPAQQVSGTAPAHAEKSTIDVEAKSKS